MPEFHINGRFPYHNSSLENKAIGASYDSSSSLMATGRSHNPTTAISTTTNTLDSEYSVCGFVFFIICFCFALAIMVAIGIRLVGKRRIMKTQESQESNVSIQMEPLSPPISMQNCNWTKKTTCKWLLLHSDSVKFEKIFDKKNYCVWKWTLFWILIFYHKQNFETETIWRCSLFVGFINVSSKWILQSNLANWCNLIINVILRLILLYTME